MVSLAVEVMALENRCFRLFVADLYAFPLSVLAKLATMQEARLGRGRPDQADEGGTGRQRHTLFSR